MFRPEKSLMMVLYASLLLLFAGTAPAGQTLETLKQAGRLKLKVWVEPTEHIIARQQVNLQIEIATDRWFSGGTRIGRFEIADAIVLQRENFAINSSRNENGESWAVQQWTLAVYPLRSGVFDVSEIPLQLSIAGENLEAIEGEIKTPGFSFIASIPAPIDSGVHWIATPRFSIEDSFDKDGNEFKPGDALTRTIKMSADNLPAMMLPEIGADNIDGVAVYSQPPRLADRVNRGDYIAERSQTFSYVFEKPGEYQLPERTYFWWNLESRSYESIKLEAHVFKVTDTIGHAESDAKSSVGLFIEYRPLFIKLTLGLLAIVLLWFFIQRYRKQHSQQYGNQAHLTESSLRKRFMQACTNNEAEQAVGLLYKWLDLYADNQEFTASVRERLHKIHNNELLVIFNQVLQSIYGPDYASEKNRALDLKLFFNMLSRELEKNSRPPLFDKFSVSLKLN